MVCVSGTVGMSRPVSVVAVSRATESSESPESLTLTTSSPAPVSSVRSAAISSTRIALLVTFTTSSPAPVITSVWPEIVRTFTVSLPTPVSMLVAPLCVDSIVSVSRPVPSSRFSASSPS